MSDQGLARSRLHFGPRNWLFLAAALAALATGYWLLHQGSTTAAPAQVSYQQQQPTEKLLVLPLMVKSPGDSAFSIAVMDVAREKLGQMARYKVQVIPKPKLCEALKASDYACDVLLDETQANQL